MGVVQQETYSASQGFTSAGVANSTVIELNGDATRTIIVTGAWVESPANTSWNWERTSTLAVGASITDTATPHDPLNTVASGVAKHFLVAPVNGVLIGRLRTMNPGQSGAGPKLSDYRFGLRNLLSQPVVLRGLTDCFVLLKIGAVGAELQYAIEWNEVG